MKKLEKDPKNSLVTINTCPVCNTRNELTKTNCTTCAWHFPLVATPQFDLELSRAKQQYQLMKTFNQMMQNAQNQNEMLEKINARMDDIEGKVNQIKKKTPANPSFTPQYEYPVLSSILGTNDFDTEVKRLGWWQQLESQWQAAFNMVSLKKAKEYQPNDEEIEYILTSPILRFVGPRGIFANMDFELTNLSGIRHFKDLTLLTFTQQAITNLEGIEHLQSLRHLFVSGCYLKNLKEVHYLPQLEHLYANVNQLEDIQTIEGLNNLVTFYCNYNELESLEGITTNHLEKLKAFYCLPNEKIPLSEIKRVEAMEIQCRKG